MGLIFLSVDKELSIQRASIQIRAESRNAPTVARNGDGSVLFQDGRSKTRETGQKFPPRKEITRRKQLAPL
jgi:hypothetical protein